MPPAIDGATKVLGLLGHHISYSLSPTIHNFSMQLMGLNQVYVPFDCAAGALPSLVKTLWDIGSPGFNVTQPHKFALASLLGWAGNRSINTAFRGDKGFLGKSTDGAGFQAALRHLGRDLKSFKKIVLIGGGGAASGIVEHLKGVGFGGEVLQFSRKGSVQGEIGSHMHLLLSVQLLEEALRSEGSDCLLVQATSGPHQGDDLAAFEPALDKYSGVVVDICYGKVSRLILAARAKGLVSQDGIPMLIEQARESQMAWWKQAAPYGAIEQELVGNKGVFS